MSVNTKTEPPVGLPPCGYGLGTRRWERDSRTHSGILPGRFLGVAGAWEDERKRRCCRSGRAGVGTDRVDPCEPLRSWASEYGVPAEVALRVFPLIDTVLPATGARSSRVQYEGRKRRSCSPS